MTKSLSRWQTGKSGTSKQIPSSQDWHYGGTPCEALRRVSAKRLNPQTTPKTDIASLRRTDPYGLRVGLRPSNVAEREMLRFATVCKSAAAEDHEAKNFS